MKSRYVRLFGGKVYKVAPILDAYGNSDSLTIVVDSTTYIDVGALGVVDKKANTLDELIDDELGIDAEGFKYFKSAFEIKTESTFEEYFTKYGGRIFGITWGKGNHGEPMLRIVCEKNDEGEWELL